MTNRNTQAPVPLGTGASPFGDLPSSEAPVDRLPGILAGNEKQLAEAVVNMVLVGGGLLVHGTRDGGAIALHVFWGKTKQTRYAASPETLQAFLEALSQWAPAQPVPLAPRASQTRQAPR